MCLLYLYCINIDMNVIRLSFEQISSIWQKHLWENRQSPIESHSAMTWPFEGDPEPYNMEIFNYKPSYFGLIIKAVRLGVPLPTRSLKMKRSFISVYNLVDFLVHTLKYYLEN